MKKIQAGFLIIAFLFLGGCVSSAKIESMSIPPQENIFSGNDYFDHALGGDISVFSVSGGDESNGGWDQFGTVSNDNFRSALVASLQNQNLYSKFGTYQLSADLISFELIGALDSEVTIEVEYQLKSSQGNHALLREKIKSSSAMTLSDEVIGAIRYRKMAEGAVKKNIEKLLVKLSMLEINDMKKTGVRLGSYDVQSVNQ
ncbi:hypothetical protein GCM10023116_48140 [Kistimonas scapharcae]|uniref:Lipoprotein n=1 Tax=Kistimonas scapharcae TaxID=1036133 RepID=A0ABP8V950_9GAMM